MIALFLHGIKLSLFYQHIKLCICKEAWPGLIRSHSFIQSLDGSGLNRPFSIARIRCHCCFIYFYFLLLHHLLLALITRSLLFGFFRRICFSLGAEHIVFIVWVKFAVSIHRSGRSSCIFSYTSCSGSSSIIVAACWAIYLVFVLWFTGFIVMNP